MSAITTQKRKGRVMQWFTSPPRVKRMYRRVLSHAYKCLNPPELCKILHGKREKKCGWRKKTGWGPLSNGQFCFPKCTCTCTWMTETVRYCWATSTTKVCIVWCSLDTHSNIRGWEDLSTTAHGSSQISNKIS